MKKKIKAVVTTIVLIIIAVWVINKIPFSQTIEQEISANIYKDGAVVSETTISMQGEKTNYLFRRDESFVGYFAIPTVEKTVDKDMETSIRWSSEKGENARYISFFKAGKIHAADKLGIVPYILINDSMTKFAIMLTDGTIISTSNELQEIYIKHITWREDTKTTSIAESNQIPEIE